MSKDVNWTYEDVSSSHLWFLRLIAFIPFENRQLSYIGTRFLSIYCHVVNTIYNTMFSSYGIRMFANKTFEVEYICEMIVVEGACFRYLLIYMKREKLIKLVQSCKELWYYLTIEETQIVRDFERKAHYFRNFMLANTLSVVTLYIITAQFVKLPQASVNGTERKSLAFRFYVDVQEEPAFLLVSIFQGIVTYSVAIIIAGIETVALYLIMMASGYLRSLRIRLLTMGKMDREIKMSDKEKLKEELFNDLLICARFHQKIMIFCEDIERLNRNVFLVAVFTTIYNMSLIGIKLLENDENKFKYASIFVLNLFQFFTCQWGPEYLLTESEAIGNAAYFASLNSNYKKKTNRILLLIMLRAQRPIQLTAGGYINLSIETFGSMVKSAFSFFAVLRSFNA